MARRVWQIGFVALVTVAVVVAREAGHDPGAAGSLTARPHASMTASLPLMFVPDSGGTAVTASSRGYDVRIDSGSATFSVGDAAVPVTLTFSARTAALSLERPLPTRLNYLTGPAPNWRTGVRTYGAVRLAQVYDGIDALFYGSDRHVEYDLIVAPGASPDRIRLRFAGVDRITLDHGALKLRAGATTLLQHAPVAYQELGGRRVPVGARYVVEPDRSVSLAVADYDATAPLVIDPTITYATYFGAPGHDDIQAIESDGGGHMYLAGNMSGSGYVAKMALDGTVPWVTMIGGSRDDGAAAVAVAPNGSIYVTGWTWSADFPTTPGAYSAASANSCDSFLSALRADGSLLASTTLGAPQPWGMGCGATDVAIDRLGRPNVVGATASPWFVPTRTDSFGPQAPGLDQPDGFFARFNAGLSAVEVSRLVAGSGFDYINAGALDQYGNLYIVGRTTSADFPVLNAYRSQKFEPGDPDGLYGYDGFLAMIWDNGTIGYSTFIGGSRDDSVNAVVVGRYDRPYVAGTTQSAETWFYKPSPVGQSSGFLFEMVPNPTGVVSGVHVGGSGFTDVTSLAVAQDDSIWVAGTSDGVGYEQNAPDDPRPQPGPGGGLDMFVEKVGPSVNWITYRYLLGGSGHDVANALALDRLGDIYVAGSSTGGYPVVNARQPQKYEPATATLDGALTKLGCYIATFLPVEEQPGAGGSGSAQYYAVDGCIAEVVSSAPWLRVTSMDTRNIYFAVEPNPTTAARTATLTLSGKKVIPITQAPGSGGGEPSSHDEIVLDAADVGTVSGEWRVVPDGVHGSILTQPDRGAPKVTTASANPSNWFEFTFTAEAGKPYHLWIHGRAQNDSWQNDSIYVQFSDSVDAAGAPVFRIGTTAATWVSLEECSGCGEQGWGWQDNQYGARGDLGPDIYFAASGTHTVRLQTREDGFDIGQVVLSARAYLRAAPGGNINDPTIVTDPSPPATAIDEIVLRPGSDASAVGRWFPITGAMLAGGSALWNPNDGAPKVAAPSANPASYFEITFTADAGKPYHLWLRMKADDDHWTNDSVWLQFSGSVDASGNPTSRIGTSSGTWVSLEECSGCGEQGWGWQDNAYGAPGDLGPPIYFATSGLQTVRVQVREDGISIDQIVLSASRFASTAPGANRNDTTILSRPPR